MTSSPYEEGSDGAKLCLIGEAPSNIEMMTGKPFAGPAGQILNECLHEASILRQECKILNVFDFPLIKDRLGVTFFHKDTGAMVYNERSGFVGPGIEALERFYDRLASTNSNCLVPMGGPALRATFSKPQITKWRGSILAGNEKVKKRKLVPTIHPASTLHGGPFIWRYMIISDLERAKQEMRSAEFDLPQRQLLIDLTHKEILDYLYELPSKTNRFSFDTEILNENVYCFSVAQDKLTSVCIPLVKADWSPRFTDEQELEIWTAFGKLLQNKKLIKCNQNILFDYQMLFDKNSLSPRGTTLDCMVMCSIMYPEFPKDLGFICSIWTREPYYKDDGKVWKKLSFDYDKFLRYCATDSAVVLAALEGEGREGLEDELDKGGFREQHDFTVSMYPALMYKDHLGMAVDIEGISSVRSKISQQLEDLYKELKEVSDYEFSPASPKQCQNYFYVHKGIKPYLNRKTGNPTTDDTALSRIVRKYNFPEARIIQRIRNLEKLRGTYIDITFDKDNRLRCSTNPRGTKFGRLSTGKTIFDRGMNMQNLDPRIKRFLKAG